ncbi:hypothetical protein Tco_1380124, partial [Tanacetum coccineum]
MGFGEKWCKWIEACQTSASISVLVNGSPTDEFKMERGLDKDYEVLSGLKINSNKTKLYGIGVQNWEIEGFANRLGITSGKMPFTYLGIPIGVNMKRVDSWNIVVEKFKKRLGNWKTKMISFVGRLTLVKSVLGSLALYFFSLFRAPMSVLKNLESLR